MSKSRVVPVKLVQFEDLSLKTVSVEEINSVMAELLAAQALRLGRAAEILVHGEEPRGVDAGDVESLVNLAQTNIRVASRILSGCFCSDIAGPLPSVPVGGYYGVRMVQQDAVPRSEARAK
jgi:hypothetical protein